MRKYILAASVVSAIAMMAGVARADPLNIVYTHHSSASNPFWQAVKKGFDDACAKIQANCQMVFTQTEGSVEQEVANQQADLLRFEQCQRATCCVSGKNLRFARQRGV